MEPFEYVMVLVSIIIGLAIAHILSALGAAVHRLRGHGPPIRLSATYLIWVGFLFTWLVSFWWWEFKFQYIDVEWSFGLYLFIIGYAIWLFLLSVILVPDRMEGVTDAFEYLMDGRAWYFGGLLGAVVLDTADSFLKGTEWGMRPIFWAQSSAYVVACVVGIVTTRRRWQLAAATVAFVVQIVYMFGTLGILGTW